MARTTEQDKVCDLQRTLYRAAEACPGRRFHALYEKVHRRDLLERAWELVRANRGAAGIDGETIADVERYGVSRLLDELAADLKEGRWRPFPARRVLIERPGREELRPLSIPTVRDRVVQAASKIVIEPIFEADFLACSFGFRPKRSTHDALQVLLDESWGGRRWAVETDIANCFEAIPHDRLMSAVEERVSPSRAQAAARDVACGGDAGRGGPPRGGRYSAGRCRFAAARQRLSAPGRPAMADARVWGAGPLRDLVVMCHTKREAEAALAALRSVLAGLGLELKQAKTRIVHLREGGEGLDFLGFHHRYVRLTGPAPAAHPFPRPLALTAGDEAGARTGP